MNATDKREYLLLAAVGLCLTVIVAVAVLAERDLARRWPVPAETLGVAISPTAAAEGERLARVRGCFWCHGPDLAGQQYFADASRGVIVVAPNLTRKVREYTPDEFARTLRHGIRPDGTSLQPAMPSFTFYNLSDADTAAIIAYIRSLPESDGLRGRFDLLPVGWFRWLAGQLPPSVAALIDHNAPRPDPAVNGDPLARGRYLAESICTECHGDNGRLRVPNSPNLVVAAAYDRAGFHRLMRTGVARGEREIDYHMVDAARYRYTSLTDAEIDALYDWFRARAAMPAP